ncbi:DUF4363 family protein [Tepidibacter formicigenes]|jgi:hypothetical protein|uniref:DUF4363 domain-containing protein n=1 Tax=Tepidibacter formicigenes DSM 15518 TaxID=1123349 RepID=A0A1M6M5W7_9FIRM|nr:DUF4363 family protein [Tepidibacter formicigenes]SHJ78827.1 protein of unknown function [Tepidibacter formicigenes DSM 15518]
MKTIIPVVILVILIIGAWFFTYKHIEDYSSDFIYSLDKISKNIKNSNWEDSYDEFLRMKKKWKRIKNTWDLLIDHQEVESINLIIEKINTYMELKNLDLTLNEITILKEVFRIIIEKESFKLTNIF